MKYVWMKLILMAAMLTLFSYGCTEKEDDHADHDHSHDLETLDPMRAVTPQRQITQVEIDSLRSWRKQLKLTRDEYWEGRGGVVGNDWAEVWYPAGNITVTHGMYVLMRLTALREEVGLVLGALPENRLMVTLPATLPAYTKDTGKDWWHYSRLEGDRIDFQPVEVLFQRGLLDSATGRELIRWMVRSLSDGKAPLWLEYGFAAILAGDVKTVEDYIGEFPDDPVVRTAEEANAALAKDDVKRDSRIACFNGLKMTERIIAEHGRQATGAFIAALKTSSLDSASKKHFSQPWADVMTDAGAWPKGWSR